MKYLIGCINDYENIDLSIIKKYKRDVISKYSELDKLRSYVGELLFIEGLKKYYNINYNNININYNSNGKPFIENYGLYFNISHSKDYVIVVFSYNDIGVDIEYIHGDINTKNIFCNTKEMEYIGSDINRLFDVFTYKEAYIKMIGDSITNINKINYFNNDNVNRYNIKLKGYSINIIEKRN